MKRPPLTVREVVLAVSASLTTAALVLAAQTPVALLAAQWGLDHLPLLSIAGTLVFLAGCLWVGMRPAKQPEGWDR